MKTILGKWRAVLVILAIYLFLILFQQATAQAALKVSQSYLVEMAMIMPAVMLLMGLIEIWVPKEKIQQYLGQGSGFRGMFLSFIVGTLPTGPLYAAFPMTQALLRKGAKISNVVIFMGAYAALKIPQLLVEIEFLGITFTALRFVLTLGMIILMSFVMEGLMKNPADHTWLIEKQGSA